MAQIRHALFVLLVVYWAEITGGEICYSSDMKAMMVQLRDYRTETHDRITAMQGEITVLQKQIKKLEEKNSVLENELKLKREESQQVISNQNEIILDLENSVRNLTHRNYQQDTEIGTIQETIIELDDKTSVLENDLRNLTQDIREARAYQQKKNQDLENNVDNVIQQNRQQKTEIETMRDQIGRIATNDSVFAEEIKNLTKESREKITDLTEKNLYLESIIRNLTAATDTSLTDMQDQVAIFKVGLAELKEKDLDMEKNVENLTQIVLRQDTQIERLSYGNSVEKVAFVARKLKNTTVSANQTIVFTTEELDSQNVYDNVTGKFMAPVTGTYLFSVQSCNYNYYYNYYYTIKSSKATDNVHAAVCHYHYGCTSVTTIAALEKYDTVWVETSSVISTNKLLDNDNAWNMFVGTLLVS